ncbi:MAG: hypothetical protein WA061_02340 [Microgenomates group bacterium]
MKLKKLLKIVLVAPSYIIVDDNGNNVSIHTNTDNKKIGDFFEVEYEIEDKKPSKTSYKREEKQSFLKEENNEE